MPRLQFRFMLLALAGLEAPLQLPLGDKGLYGEDCVFVANDWHAALVPVYLAAKYRPHGVYSNARSVMAIHNLRHQVGSQPRASECRRLAMNEWSTGDLGWRPVGHACID